jgi:hypothetical protein
VKKKKRRASPQTHCQKSRRAFLPRHFIKQRLGVVSEFEALGEPAVDFGEHLTGLVALALPFEQAGKAGGRPQFEKSGLLAAGDVERGAKAGANITLKFAWPRNSVASS